MKQLYTFILVVLTSLAFGQETKISGIVFDGEFNEPLPFVNVLIDGTTIGTTTDFDGNYNLELLPGKYSIVFSFVGYETLKITEINVEEGKIVELDAIMNPALNSLEEVVVVSTASRNSETSVLNIQKRAVNLMDGLSIQAMRKSGDSDIASAIKRVPGISVQGGKYVYVRGLGDRYSKTTINGIQIPGLDPNKNTVQLDIFPTDLIDNLIVNKSANSALPADFSGGLVNIKIKDFPKTPQINVGFSVSYNPSMHFNDGYIRDPLNETGFIFKDSNLRNLPFDKNIDTPAPLWFRKDDAERLTELTGTLNKTLNPITDTSFMDYNFSISAGNSYKLKNESTLGYILSFGYDFETTFYDDLKGASAIKQGDTINYFNSYENLSGNENELIHALIGISYKTKTDKFSANLLRITNLDSNATNYFLEDYIDTEYTADEHGIYYTERNVTFIPLVWEGSDENRIIEYKWSFAKAIVSLKDKDFKTTSFLNEGIDSDGNPMQRIAATSTGFPERLWRNLDEKSNTIQNDNTLNLDFFGYTQKMNFGLSYLKKERDFNTFYYNVGFLGNSRLLGGDPDLLLDQENIWTRDNRTGSYLIGGVSELDQYKSESITKAVYISTELRFSEKLKSVLGVRYEEFESFYTGVDFFNNKFDKQKFVHNSDFFPQANLIWSFSEDSNFRASTYKTTARPSFKESSTIYLYDPIMRRTYIGNPEVKSSYINNLDFRLEHFGENNQMAAISFFLKEFENPIEIVSYSDLAPNQFTARNSDKAQVKGVELELRKNLFNNDINLVAFNLNATYIEASQQMTDSEYESRIVYDPDVSRERELQGQSPYMINAGVRYTNKSKFYELGLYFNVQGKTLERVGIANVPDVYSLPFNDLNLNFQKRIGEKQNKSITVKIKNLLNNSRISEYQIDGFDPKHFLILNPGTEFSIGYSIKF